MKDRVFSGIQPTGELHIGNYLGAVKNWVNLLDDYECIFSIVDYHAITIQYDVKSFKDRVYDTVLNVIACGLDPEKCKIFIQSSVSYHTELCWILNTVTPIGDLERMTQFKDKAEQNRKNVNAGLLNYPVLMAADIVLYKAKKVPVGDDQLQHLELTREIVRHFNYRFGEVLVEPTEILSPTPRIMGLDGKSKMSKSMNNYIGMMEDEKSITEKIMKAVTDENRKRRTDKGNPDICNIFSLHKAFSKNNILQDINIQCREAHIGCVDCKRMLISAMIEELKPIQERKKELLSKTNYINDFLSQSTKFCYDIAKNTMESIKEAMGLIKYL